MPHDGPRPGPTMDDVAARAGVSRALVSLVMRASPKVSAHRREAVLRAAEDLGYAPHAMARSLASRTSPVLGVLVSDLHNVFFAEVFDGLEAGVLAEGFQVVLNTGGRRVARERAAMHSLLSFRPAGLALLGPVAPPKSIAAAAARAPVVLVARSSRMSDVDTVNDDGHAGSRLAVDHLVGLGHRRIVHFDGGNGSQSAPRRRGYVTAMRAHGLRPLVLPSEYTDVAGASAAAAMLARPGRRPSAVVAANDLNAVGVISALTEAGLRVPDDVSVVGYDNTALAAMAHVGLTTVDQPRYELGALAATALLERVRGERAEPVRKLLRPTLVPRRTTAPARND